MDHIAIMKKSWKLIPKIVSGEKTIESRWYQTKRIPWNRITNGDIIFFKDTGDLVSVRACVFRVLQFEITTIADVERMLDLYGKKICLINKNPSAWNKLPRYCILLFLTDVQTIQKPFQINKKGFGVSTAWITVPDIRTIRI